MNEFDQKLYNEYTKFLNYLKDKYKLIDERDKIDFDKYMYNNNNNITEGQKELGKQLEQNDHDRTQLGNKIKEIELKISNILNKYKFL